MTTSEQQQINSLLAQCQSLATKPPKKTGAKVLVQEMSSGEDLVSFESSLKSLYQAMLKLGDSDETSDGFRQSVSERLIYNMDRVITSFDAEIEGHFLDDNWGTSHKPEHERLIDKILDLCGYGISLEVSVECLRKIAMSSNRKSTSSEKPNLAAVITSLRTVRRRLLGADSNDTDEHLANVINLSQIDSIRHQDHDTKRNKMIVQIILPLEYYQQQKSTSDNEFLLSESLVSLSTKVIPSLVSSACHAAQLSLPMWASKEAHVHLLNSAFGMVIAGNTLQQCLEKGLSPKQEHDDDICASISKYFQGMLSHMIFYRGGNAAIRLLYQAFTSKSNGDTDYPRQLNSIDPRSILCSHLNEVLVSTPAKRQVATFIRAMIRFVASKHKAHLEKACSTHPLDAVCRQEILPIIEYFLRPALVSDSDMGDAVINFAILSPPVALKGTEQPASIHVIEKVVPRCISMLICSACKTSSASYDNSGENLALLTHLSNVAAIWCEEIFVSKTAPLQQHYITEFLLYPLENNVLTQESIQLGNDDSGSSLAGMLIQGVSLRLEVSRSQSIRKDGMRVAEAMARVFGQTLSFDEGPVDEPQNIDDVQQKQSATTVSNLDSGSASLDSDSSSWGEDSLEPYQMDDDDEEDLRRVPRPRSLRDCVAYLLTNNEEREAYDKHEAALQELPALVSSEPLDLVDVVPTVVRVLLHIEDKFNMDHFLENRWNSLIACALKAPVETCFKLIEEMKGHVSLGTRLEALSVIRCAAEELSGISISKERRLDIKKKDSSDLTQMSTRLRNSLALSTKGDDSAIESKTRRWRRTRPTHIGITNTFNAVSAQMILSLFAFFAQTKGDQAIWGGSIGERFLSEFLQAISCLVDCARTYPSSRVFASDLFQLAWSFHDAKNSQVRHAVLVAIATGISVDPVAVGQVDNIIPFLAYCSSNDEDAECREIAKTIVGTISSAFQNPMLT